MKAHNEDKKSEEAEIEPIEAYYEEFFSVDLAESEQITIEKSIDLSSHKNRRADMNYFDFATFYRKNGVNNIEDESAQM